MAEIIAAVTGICSCLCAQNCLNEALSQKCTYLKSHDKHLEELKGKSDELSELAQGVNRALKHAEEQDGKKPNATVIKWQDNVQEIVFAVDKLVEVGKDKKCLKGILPNYFSRLKFGKQIKEKITEVDKLLEKGKFSNGMFMENLPRKGNILPTTTTLVGQATAEVIVEIWKYLAEEKVGRIGVYGMGGVGKTSIMKEINNRLSEDDAPFNSVIWVTVTKESNLHKLQEDISVAVDLDLSKEEDQMRRASKLLEALKRRNRFLFILDDIWTSYSLEDIGIPDPAIDHRCKLLLTTRSLAVCRGMETDKNIDVKVLSEEESWSLFSEKAGYVENLSPELSAVAKEVAKECGGLPLAIVTVGRALREVTNEMEWVSALKVLSSSTENVEDMEEKVFSRLRFSYERLKDDMTRSCFLYCALYPEDHQIEAKELIEYWMWEGLLGDVGRIQDNMVKGGMILKNLKNACMLESMRHDGEAEHIKMHDLMRDMALRLSPSCIIRAGIGLHKPPLENLVEDVERISLMRNDLKFLRGEPFCPKLSTLLLQYNSIEENLSHNFFYHMYSLSVLDLSYTGIHFLPDSVSDLENLRALLLHDCWNLTRLPNLGMLKELRVLDFSRVRITELPEGIDMLTKLRRLGLTGSGVEMFPVGLISSLTFLEELLMDRCWAQCGLEFIVELTTSISLSIIEVCLLNAEDFDTYIKSGHWNQLQSFKFCVGGSYSNSDLGKNSIDFVGNFHLDIMLPDPAVAGASCTGFAPPYITLPDHTSELQLCECHDINRLSICLSNLTELRLCKIIKCDQLECIIMSGENNLTTLQSMELHGLKKLRTLCEGVVLPNTLSSLKILHVRGCDSLKSLFTYELLQQLQNLEEIFLDDCAKMEELIEEGTGNSADIKLLRLKQIKLSRLWRLKSIYGGVVVSESLSTIEIDKCENLKRLPVMTCEENGQLQQPPPSLKQIKGEKDWWDSLEWDHPDTKTLMQPFFHMW